MGLFHNSFVVLNVLAQLTIEVVAAVFVVSLQVLVVVVIAAIVSIVVVLEVVVVSTNRIVVAIVLLAVVVLRVYHSDACSVSRTHDAVFADSQSVCVCSS